MPFTLRNIKEDLEDIGSRFDGAPDLEFRAATEALDLERSALSYQRVPPGYRLPLTTFLGVSLSVVERAIPCLRERSRITPEHGFRIGRTPCSNRHPFWGLQVRTCSVTLRPRGRSAAPTTRGGRTQMDKRVGVLGTTFAVVAASATCATAAPSNLTQYRSQVNALCRSYTPRMKRVEAAMLVAQKAGDAHKFAFQLGVLINTSLAEGIRVEATPLPADARTVMAKPLRLLRFADNEAKSMLRAAVAGDQATVVTGAATLQRVGASLNRAFDEAGLRDCGSNQT